MHSGPLVTAAHAELLSTDYWTNWVPGWRPFHTSSLLFTGWLSTELATELPRQSSTSRHFTQLNCWQLPTTRLMSSLYSLGADPIENAASNNPSVVVGGCLAIDWISFPREPVYRPLLINGCLFIHLLHSNGCTRPFRSLPSNGSIHHSIFNIIASFISRFP
jgi:hypothetical protein